MIKLARHKIVINNLEIIDEIQTSFGRVFFGGYFIHNQTFYDKRNIAVFFKDGRDFIKELPHLIGEFLLILEGHNELLAIVDRKRSIPLFYYQENDTWIISDKVQLSSPTSLNEVAVKEFILTGFTAGPKTLYKEVFQIEAGNYIQISALGELKKNEYYQFYHQPVKKDIEEFSEELSNLFMEVFEDLYKRLNHKVPILPLSGGYDSRIIALLLKEFGIKDVRSFTYGKSGNKESLVSKDIADRLGLEWTFIEYKKEDWKKWYQSEQWSDYVDFASNASSMAHLQDWPAVTEIINKKDEDYVFIPGHSGDFLAGSHLSYEITIDKTYTKQDVANFVLQKHHKLWEMEKGISGNGRDVFSEVISSFGQLPFETNEEATALFEYWDWKERQAKFIINSVRVYEFYHKAWELPLWDDRLMDFFKQVPVELRFKKYLYDYTLNKMYPGFFPVPHKPEGKKASLKDKYGMFYGVAKKAYNQKKLYQQYFTEPMEWFGIYGSYSRYVRELSFKYDKIKYKQPYNINSFLVKDYILSLKGDSK